MKNLFLLFIVIGTNTIFCQVGIGTILPDVSSSLDINSANSGLLIPRVNLINVNDSTTPVNNPAVSLLVYNINTTLIGGNGVGYYYWNGTIWTKLYTLIDEKWTKNNFGQMFPATITDKIGIGTNNPMTDLHVKSTSSFPAIFDGGTNLFIPFAENGIYRGYFGSYSGNPNDIEFGTYSGNTGTVHLTTNNSPKLSVIDNGNVGIGTTIPTSKLNVNGQITIDQKNFGGYGGLLIKGDAPGSNYPNIVFSTLNDSGLDEVTAYIGGNINDNTTGVEAMDLSFLTSQNGLGGLSEKLRIKDNGNVGIGTITPSEKLEISGKIKITDGSQATGRVLVSNATGVGTWTQTSAITPAVVGVFVGGGANFGNGTTVGVQSAMTYCNVYIDIPNGKWIVFGTYLLAGVTTLTSGQSVFVRTTLSTSNVVVVNSDVVSGGLVSGTLAGPSDFGIANGQTIINNTSGAIKRYYLWGNVQKYGTTPTTFSMGSVGSNFWSENQLSAIPTN